MDISSKTAPLRGQTVFQAQVSSELRNKDALSERLTTEAVRGGFVAEADRAKFHSCFEEAVKNAIVHGNECQSSREVFARLFYDGGEWGILIEDQGGGFRNSDVPDPQQPEFPWTDIGRGLKVMEHVMDRVEFFDSGSTVVLTKEVGSLQLSIEKEQLEACSVFLKPVENATVARLVILHANDDEVDRVFQLLEDHCRSNPDGVLVLDFGSVDYLNSSNVAMLVRLVRGAKGCGVDLRLAALRDDLVTLFGILRLNEILAIFDTVDAAVQATVEA